MTAELLYDVRARCFVSDNESYMPNIMNFYYNQTL
jgi:hypothetical protein